MWPGWEDSALPPAKMGEYLRRPGEVIPADGFSCRTQIEQRDAGGRQAPRLAELLAGGLHGEDAVAGADPPERVYAVRPQTPAVASIGALLAVSAAVALVTATAIRLIRRR